MKNREEIKEKKGGTKNRKKESKCGGEAPGGEGRVNHTQEFNDEQSNSAHPPLGREKIETGLGRSGGSEQKRDSKKHRSYRIARALWARP